MKVKVTLNKAVIQRISDAAKAAAVDTMDAVLTDVQDTVPLDNGTLMNGMYVDSADMDDGYHVWIDHDSIYARYLYMGVKMVDSKTGKGPALVHDKYGGLVGPRFRKGAKLKVKQPEEKLTFKNDRTDHWFAPYINDDGDKKDFIRDKYTELFRRRAGL